jgi:hypothetical protein
LAWFTPLPKSEKPKMIPEKEYPEIAKGLLEKTRRGNVNWSEQANQRNQSGYRLDLPESVIELNYCTPDTEPNFFQLKLFNKNGRIVGSWFVSEGDERWSVLDDLYSEITRRLTGWDKVLEDVKKFVGK